MSGDERFPASPQQTRVAAQWRLTGAGLPTIVAVRLDRPTDEKSIEAAIAASIERHEILRTAVSGNPPEQVIMPTTGAPSITVIRQAGADAATERRVLTETFDALRERSTPEEPGVDATLIEWSAERRTLVLAASAARLDARSAELFATEVITRIVGSDDVGDEPMQYADVTAWLNELLEDPEEEEGRRFWRESAHTDPSAVHLPVHDERATDRAFAPSALRATLDASPIDALATIAGTTREAILLAAFRTVLGRFTQGAELVIGLGSGGRDLEELEGVVGPLARLLPLDVTVDLEQPLTAAAKAVARQADRVREWQAFYDWSKTPHGPDGFFRYSFDYHRRGNGAVELIESWSDRTELGLWCEDNGTDLQVTVAFDGAALSAADARRMIDATFASITDAATAPDKSAGDLRVLSAEEWQRLVVDFNQTDAPFPQTTIHAEIEAQIDETPERVAVLFEGGESLTYADLETRANQLAHHLRALSVGPNVRVALAVDRSVDMIVGILGILKAGGCYVPIDPAYPADRIAFMVEQTGAPVAVTHRGYDSHFPADVTRVRLDDDRAALDRESATRPKPNATTDDLVYVIYTSGSTGRPKGVMITHAGLVISNRARMAAFDGDVGTFLLLSPLAFDSLVPVRSHHRRPARLRRMCRLCHRQSLWRSPGPG